MRVSVITAALNEELNVQAAIRSAIEAGADEVVVVDGGSSDATADVAAQTGANVIRTAAGRAKQQNAGVDATSGDVLLFLHADCTLGKDAIRQIRDRGASFFFGAFRQKIDDPATVYRLVERGNNWRIRWLGLPYGDQAIAVRRSLLEQAGKFADVPFLEDYLLSQTLRRRHWPQLLPGPVYASSRRWRKQGVVRQTLLNWRLLAAYHRGVPIAELATRYRRHDQPKP
ncbi:MAG: TIGR04283 family arsenosugar biosynthesis glycosyltransferase [Blastopirellula sp. JB062]